jgi:hypothetical protein
VPIHPKSKRHGKSSIIVPALKPATKVDIDRMVLFLGSLLRLSSKEVSLLMNIKVHMLSLLKNSGVKFCITYYSEVLRLVYEYLSGRGLGNTKTWVKVTQSGLPKVIGKEMCLWITLNKEKLISNKIIFKDRKFLVFRAILTVIALFRTMSPKHVIKFDSVTAPFSGSVQTLPKDNILEALRTLKISVKPKSPKFFWSNKAGVNSHFAFLSIGLDFIGIIGNPHVWFGHIVYAFKMKYFLYIIIFIIMTIWCFPLFLISYPIHGIFPLGRLSIVKELRGKARVVGITDYWTQILFKPLHDAIYLALGDVPNDGTDNQLAPVRNLIYSNPTSVVSVDLTAATDRLPVELQKDILEALNLPGTWWKVILDRPYYYMENPIKYSVGQPMGAYSSFAMLALTNHVIMHCAANSRKVRVFAKSYAILGDDVAINDSTHLISDSYISLLTSLGVEVNPIKGFNGKLLEFAKRIITIGDINLSPIGGKALLRASRSPIYMITLIIDMASKDFFKILELELSMFTIILDKFFSKKGMNQAKWLLSFLGPQGGLWTGKAGVSVYALQRLFNQFLEQFFGDVISRFSIQNYFEEKILKLAKIPTHSIVNAGENLLRIYGFISSPMIWSSKKFINSLVMTPENTAALTTASGSVILFPVLTVYLICSYLIVVYSIIISRIKLMYQPDEDTLDRVLEFFSFINSDSVNRLITIGLRDLDTVNYHIDIYQFAEWMLSYKLPKPIQLLDLRFVKTRGLLDEDILPVLVTSEKCLSANSSQAQDHFSRIRKIERLKLDIKVLKQKLRILSERATSK